MGRKIKNRYIGEFKVWVKDSNNVFELLDHNVRIKLPSINEDYVRVVAGKLLSEHLYQSVGNFELVSYSTIK